VRGRGDAGIVEIGQGGVVRFQKRIKILPGVTLNLSKSGVSTSVGVPGARVTYGRGKKRVTVGVPGSGISHTTVESSAAPASELAPAPPSGWRVAWGHIATVGVAVVTVLGLVLGLFALLGGGEDKPRRKR
jgi:hypothetical protein